MYSILTYYPKQFLVESHGSHRPGSQQQRAIFVTEKALIKPLLITAVSQTMTETTSSWSSVFISQPKYGTADVNVLVDLSLVIHWLSVNNLWSLFSGSCQWFPSGIRRQLLSSVDGVYSVFLKWILFSDWGLHLHFISHHCQMKCYKTNTGWEMNQINLDKYSSHTHPDLTLFFLLWILMVEDN